MTTPNDNPHEFARHDLDESPPPAKRKRVHKLFSSEKHTDDAHVTEQLTEIYENADGSMPDMRHIEHRKKHRLWRAFASLLFACVFLGAVAWVGFFVLQPAATFRDDRVVLSVAGPESARVGEEVRYRIRYRNAESMSLDKVVLQVRYPDGFVLTESSRPSANEAHDEWDLGTLDPEESGYIDLVGQMFGDAKKAQSFRIFLNYTPANFSSEFQKVATANIAVTDAPITASIAAKTEVVSGADTEFTVTIEPAEGMTLQYIAVDILPSDRFHRKSSKPAEDPTTPYRWLFDTVAAKQTITLSGAFIGTSDAESADIRVVVRGWKDKARGGEGYVYNETTGKVAIVKTALAVTLAINGTVKDMPVSPGDILNASIVVRNAGSTPLDNAVARVIFDAPSAERQSMLDWKMLDDTADGDIIGEQVNAETRRGIISWNSTHFPELQRLDPGEEVTIDFHLPIKNAEDTDLSDFKNPKIVATAEAQSGRGKDRQILGTNPIAMTMLSDAVLDVEHDVGEAPGGREVHLVSWIIHNSFHALSNIRVEAEVYGDVVVNTSTAEVSAGQLVFDATTKKVTWTIPEMPVSTDVLALEFPIVLQSKNATQKNLTSKITFSAQDTVAGQEIVKAGDEILLQ